MKTALIGLSNNVAKNIGKIRLWSSSFKRFSSGEVVLLCANSTETELEMCRELGIRPIPVVVQDTWYINHERLRHTRDFIKTSDVELFVVTDVFDVIFQGDPFSKLNINDFGVFVSGEGVRVNQEPWNSDNIKKIFPDQIHKCEPIEVINSGVIAGKRENLIELFDSMYSMCELGYSLHNIKDQAALIVMIANSNVPSIKIFNLDDAWAMHCAVAGPTQFFNAWGFNTAIKYGIPKMVNDVVVNGSGERYDIVHQFNRVPEWRSILEKPYNA